MPAVRLEVVEWEGVSEWGVRWARWHDVTAGNFEALEEKQAERNAKLVRGRRKLNSVTESVRTGVSTES